MDEGGKNEAFSFAALKGPNATQRVFDETDPICQLDLIRSETLQHFVSTQHRDTTKKSSSPFHVWCCNTSHTTTLHAQNLQEHFRMASRAKNNERGLLHEPIKSSGSWSYVAVRPS